MQHSWLAVAVPFLMVEAGLCFGADELRSYLPIGYEGFLRNETLSTFCTPSNMTWIYDGGYLTYVDQGTLLALQQFYSGKEGAYYTVTLHWMNSRENASRILNYFRGLFAASPGLNDVALGEGGFEFADCCLSYLYFCQGRLFVAIEGTGGLSARAMELSAQEIVRKAIADVSVWVALLLGAFVIRLRVGAQASTG